MSERVLVLYHGGCDDGFGGALAAWLRLGDQAEYRGLDFTEKAPDVRGREVVMIDFFPYGREWLEKCGAYTMTILDHHKTAEASLAGLPQKPGCSILGATKVSIVFDMNRSGATIAWEHFHPGEPVPEFFRYLEDRDLFRNSLPGNAEFTMALRSYEQRFEVWEKFLERDVMGMAAGVEHLRKEGDAINRFYARKCLDVVATARRMLVQVEDGLSLEVPVVNCPWFMGSDVCHQLARGEHFALYWYTKGEDVCWGARSVEGGMDVSKIAKFHGGGGHKHAAGWVVKGAAQFAVHADAPRPPGLL